MRVRLQGDTVKGIGKHLSRAHGHGEFCGVSLLRNEAKLVYADIASRVEWQGRTNIYYEDIYAEMFDRVVSKAAPVQPGEYAEVDEPADLQAAAAVIRSLRRRVVGRGSFGLKLEPMAEFPDVIVYDSSDREEDAALQLSRRLEEAGIDSPLVVSSIHGSGLADTPQWASRSRRFPEPTPISGGPRISDREHVEPEPTPSLP